jgi:hypothetical protein
MPFDAVGLPGFEFIQGGYRVKKNTRAGLG